MENIMDKIKNTRILALVGLVGMLIGIFGTYVDMYVIGYSIIDSWVGKVMLVVLILDMLVIFRDVVERHVPGIFNNEYFKKIADKKIMKTPAMMSGIIVALSAYAFLSLDISMKYLEIGFYGLLVGCISLIGYHITHKDTNNIDIKTNDEVKEEDKPKEEEKIETENK